jgi:hypothetical protein
LGSKAEISLNEQEKGGSVMRQITMMMTFLEDYWVDNTKHKMPSVLSQLKANL